MTAMLMKNINHSIHDFQRFTARNILKTRVRNKSFTIISNDCWGGRVYQELGLPYASPFVGLFVLTPCYLKLLKNLRGYLSTPLKFTNSSRYTEYLNQFKSNHWYPIGLLNDVEIHFVHYATELEALEKWNRRRDRINWNEIFIKFSADKDLCTAEDVKEFEQVNFPYKICFSSKNRPDIKSAITINEYVVDGSKMYAVCQKYFDISRWLNKEESINISPSMKLLNTILYWHYHF